MKTLNIHAAKTHFSRIIKDAEAGEETVIAKAGVPVAKVIPIGMSMKERKLGTLAGTYPPPPDNFDDPLPDEILDLFEGR